MIQLDGELFPVGRLVNGIRSTVVQSIDEVVDRRFAVCFVPQMMNYLPSASISHKLEKRVETAFCHSI